MTTTDTSEYAIPKNMKHAMDLITQVHGFAAPIQEIAAVVGWNAKWESADVAAKCQRAASLLAEAAKLLFEAEAEEACEVLPDGAVGECRECLGDVLPLVGGLCENCREEG